MKEEFTTRPKHYSSGMDVAKIQEQVHENLLKDSDNKKRAMWVSFAVKHLLRAGLKDDVDIELLKAENYLHRARTGEWLKDLHKFTN